MGNKGNNRIKEIKENYEDKRNENIFTNTKTISDHTRIVNSLILLKDKRIASSSQDNTIKIFDSNNNYKCDITITGHRDYVTSITELENGKIASCSWDKTIKIWLITKNSYQPLYTITNAHNDRIYKIITFPNNRIATISNDNTIKIWKTLPPYDNNPFITLNCVIKKSKTDNSIRYYTIGCSLLYMKNKNILVSGTRYKELIIWSIETYQSINIVKDVGCYWSHSIYQFDNDRIIVGGRNVFCVVFVDRIGSYIESSYTDNSLGFVLCFNKIIDDNDIVICGCQGGKMLQYDIQSKNILIIPSSHTSFINDILIINKNTFLTCSTDNTIKEWKMDNM